jgi:hypothetical protein
MMAVADKEAADKRAAEEAAMKRAVEERATVKAAAAEEVAGKTTDEAAGAAGGSPAPSQTPSVAGAKRAAALTRQPNIPIVCPAFSPPPFPVGLHSLITLFAQVLSLRRGHRDGPDCFCRRHRCRRCGYQGDSYGIPPLTRQATSPWVKP